MLVFKKYYVNTSEIYAQRFIQREVSISIKFFGLKTSWQKVQKLLEWLQVEMSQSSLELDVPLFCTKYTELQ
jgi:hypothetical protein